MAISRQEECVMDPKLQDQVVDACFNKFNCMYGDPEKSLLKTLNTDKKDDQEDDEYKAIRDRWEKKMKVCVADLDSIETKGAELQKSVPTHIDAVKTTVFVSLFAGIVTILINNESAIIYWFLQVLLQILIVAIKLYEYTSYQSLMETCNRIKKLKKDQDAFFENATSVLVDLGNISEDILGQELLQKIERFHKSTLDRVPVKTVKWTIWASWTFSALFSVALPLFLSVCMGMIDKGAKEKSLHHIKGGC